MAHIIHDEWILPAALRIYWEKPIHAPRPSDFLFQIWPFFEPEYLQAYLGLVGV